MNPELIERKPEYAQTLQALRDQFERNYDLTKVGEQASLVEGVKALAIMAATGSLNGSLSVEEGADGIRRITVTTTPVPATT